MPRNLPKGIYIVQLIRNNEIQETRNEWFPVSPKPSSGDVVVSLSSNGNKNIVFELSNAVGKTLYTQAVEATKGNNSFHLNLNKITKLPAGVYFVKANGMEGDNVKRIVISSK